ncbi:hypothetical protein OXX80_000154 [Metschnikowia pulcherrima]
MFRKKSAFAEKLETQEKYVKEAIRDRSNGVFSSLKKAAEFHGVKLGTVQKRKQGRCPRGSVHTQNHKLDYLRENPLCRWILTRDEEGIPTRRVEVENMARVIIEARDSTIVPIGKDWVKTLADRNNLLTTEIMKGYVCKDVDVEYLEHVRSWFNDVREKIDKHNISTCHIYKLDMAGIQIGRVGFVEDEAIFSRPEEWVTIVECINAQGFALDPFIMFKKRTRQRGLYEHVPFGWKVESIPLEWGNEEIEIEWLTKHFLPMTVPVDPNRFRLLLIDGHKGRGAEAVAKICKDHNVILVCTPSNSSYLFHGLDVSCFPNIKKFYHQRIQKAINVVKQKDRIEFIEEYANARSETTFGYQKIKKRLQDEWLDAV